MIPQCQFNSFKLDRYCRKGYQRCCRWKERNKYVAVLAILIWRKIRRKLTFWHLFKGSHWWDWRFLIIAEACTRAEFRGADVLGNLPRSIFCRYDCRKLMEPYPMRSFEAFLMRHPRRLVVVRLRIMYNCITKLSLGESWIVISPFAPAKFSSSSVLDCF